MKILGQIRDKKMSFSDYNSRKWHDYVEDPKNEGRTIVVQDRVPESKEQRGFYHGAVLRLWGYLNGWDYRDSNVIEFLHEEAKREFNGTIEILDGKKKKVGQSTKGLLGENDQQNSGYIERIISYLEENYSIDRQKVLNTEDYQDFMDRIYSVSDYDDYIAYLVELGHLPKIKTHKVFK